jgi:hypothetical protein
LRIHRHHRLHFTSALAAASGAICFSASAATPLPINHADKRGEQNGQRDIDQLSHGHLRSALAAKSICLNWQHVLSA